jgi:perosamine synthetase
MNWKMPLFKTYWEEDDIEAVASVIKRGMYWADGPEIALFEKLMEKYKEFCSKKGKNELELWRQTK